MKIIKVLFLLVLSSYTLFATDTLRSRFHILDFVPPQTDVIYEARDYIKLNP